MPTGKLSPHAATIEPVGHSEDPEQAKKNKKQIELKFVTGKYLDKALINSGKMLSSDGILV